MRYELLQIILLFSLALALTGCGSAPKANPEDYIEAEIIMLESESPLSDLRPMVMIKGELYFDTGEVSTAVRCGNMDGEISSSVAQTAVPTEDNQSNFGSGYGYQFAPKDTIEVCINEQWIIFEKEQ